MFSDFRNKKRTRVSFCDQGTRPLLGRTFCASQSAAQVAGKSFIPC